MSPSELIKFLKAGEVKGKGSAKQLLSDPSVLGDLRPRNKSRDFFFFSVRPVLEKPCVIHTMKYNKQPLFQAKPSELSAGALAEHKGVDRGQVALFPLLSTSQKLLITE